MSHPGQRPSCPPFPSSPGKHPHVLAPAGCWGHPGEQDRMAQDPGVSWGNGGSCGKSEWVWEGVREGCSEAVA